MGKHTMKYSVQTEGGISSVLAKTSRVFVRIGDQYVEKQVSDLKRGELVLVKNEHIDADLLDVDGILRRRSSKYLDSLDSIFFKNSEGKEIPVFRKYLWDGILKKSEFESLDELIAKEKGKDFSKDDYDLGTQVVREKASEVKVKDNTIKTSWLSGKAIAPQDWSNFKYLVDLNPVFKEISDSKERNDDFYESYQNYVGSRRTVMRHLAERKGLSSIEKGKNLESKISRSFADEISAVVGELLSEVSEGISAMEVKSVELLNGNSNRNLVLVDPSLTKALVTKKLPNGCQSMDQRELIRDYSILTYIFQEIVKDISKLTKNRIGVKLQKVVMDDYLFFHLLTKNNYSFFIDQLFNLISEENLGLDFLQIENLNMKFKLIGEYSEKLLKDRSLDESFNLNYGSVSKLYDTLNRMQSAIPDVLIYKQLIPIQCKVLMYSNLGIPSEEIVEMVTNRIPNMTINKIHQYESKNMDLVNLIRNSFKLSTDSKFSLSQVLEKYNLSPLEDKIRKKDVLDKVKDFFGLGIRKLYSITGNDF